MYLRNFIFKVVADSIGVTAYFSDLKHLQSVFNVPLSEMAKFHEYLYDESFKNFDSYRLSAVDDSVSVSVIALDYISEVDYEKIVSNFNAKSHD